MSKKDQVETLLSIQRIDREIEERENELEGLAPEVRALEERVEGLEGEVAEARRRLEEAEKEQRGDERAVQAGRSTLKRLQERAEQVETAQQHRAVRSELATARRNLEQSEEEAMESLQRVDRIRRKLRDLEAELEEARAELEEHSGEALARREALEEELSRQIEVRESRAESVDDRALSLYERVREGTTADALAPLDDDHCGHCFTMIPPQKRREIRKGSQLVRCEGCGIILYSSELERDTAEVESGAED